MEYSQDRVIKAIEAFRQGEMVIVSDDDSRENEGDLILAATHCTDEKMAFLIRHSSGIICTPMPESIAKQLHLSPMVEKNDSAHHTAFTVSVDYKYGTKTGISAHDRTLAVRALAEPSSQASDFLRPGHVFPLIAREGGVLMRSGHTEAAVDLCLLARLAPVGVIGELVNDDGSVKNGKEIKDFAKEHNLLTLTVDELIAYRQRTEKLIEHLGTKTVTTVCGPAIVHSFQLPGENLQHVALVFGDITDGEAIPVRLQRENVIEDIFCETGSFKTIVSEMLKKQKRGVFVYLREGSAGVSGNTPMHALEEEGKNCSEKHDHALKREKEWCEIGLGAQILKELKIDSVILMAFKERHYVGLEGFGIKILKTEIL